MVVASVPSLRTVRCRLLSTNDHAQLHFDRIVEYVGFAVEADKQIVGGIEEMKTFVVDHVGNSDKNLVEERLREHRERYERNSNPFQ